MAACAALAAPPGVLAVSLLSKSGAPASLSASFAAFWRASPRSALAPESGNRAATRNPAAAPAPSTRVGPAEGRAVGGAPPKTPPGPAEEHPHNANAPIPSNKVRQTILSFLRCRRRAGGNTPCPGSCAGFHANRQSRRYFGT